MNTAADSSTSHRNVRSTAGSPTTPATIATHTNQLIHVICVPAILWSVIALLWCIPAPGTLVPRRASGPALAMLASVLFYYRASRALGLGMLAVYVLMGLLTRWLHDSYGTQHAAVAGDRRVRRRLDRPVRRPQQAVRRQAPELLHRPDATC